MYDQVNKLINQVIDEMIKRNMTIKELSDKSGVTKTTIYDIVNKMRIPRLDTLLLLADAVGLKIKLINK